MNNRLTLAKLRRLLWKRARHEVCRTVVLAQCWWFGCLPDYERGDASGADYVVPCHRCKAHDTSYADRVGDTRHNRFMGRVRYWCWRRWWPARCRDCGHRSGDHSQCLPF